MTLFLAFYVGGAFHQAIINSCGSQRIKLGMWAFSVLLWLPMTLTIWVYHDRRSDSST